jgi:hypothetical protein
MRWGRTYRATWRGVLVACAAFAGCTYNFDTLVAPTGSGGTAGTSGAAGLGGQGGASGALGSLDGSMEGGGSAGEAGSGAAGNAGAGGTGGTAVDADLDGPAFDGGRGDVDRGDGAADAGTGGDASAATDRRPDAIPDVRSETGFDCAAVSGTVYQGHCYYPSSTPTSWDVAHTTACVAPAHLAVITTAGEQGVVAAILPGQERWIGLRKDPGPPNQESRFYWVTKEPVSFKMWDSYDTGPPEPNFTGDCVRMRPSKNWGDTPCTEAYGAVCEYE